MEVSPFHLRGGTSQVLNTCSRQLILPNSQKIFTSVMCGYESATLDMPANLENSAVATGLENVSFHSNPKEKQCQRMLKLPHNCPHLTH